MCLRTGSAWLLAMMLGGSAWAASPVDDPLRSPGWRWMAERYFGDAKVHFNPEVRVSAPKGAEDAMTVPVGVDARALKDVQEILVFADLNPITTILRYHPAVGTPATIAFRFKIQQATPVRAAVRTGDGTWHVGGVWVDAAGGGCTAPSEASGGGGGWQERFGEVSLQQVARENGLQRLRAQIIHPMDTGLADGIPAFYVDEWRFLDGQDNELARLETFEPVSENPLISVDLPQRGPLRLEARDGQGNRFQGKGT